MAIDKQNSVALDKSFFGESAINVGMRGSGKSYGARVIIEEARELGVPVIVIDPQDAHGNYPGFDYVHIKNVKNLEKYGSVVAHTGASIVLRTKGLVIEEQQRGVRLFLRGYRKGLKKGIQYIVIDEIHKFAPEQSNPESKDEVRSLFQENRSDGVGALGISQRPARLDKTVLSQADHLMLFRVTSSADKVALRGYLDDANDVERLKDLQKGNAMLVGFGREGVEPVAIRKANTEHTGGSPEHIKSTDDGTYNKHRRKLVRGEPSTMSETVSQKDLVNDVIPGTEGFMDLAGIGARVSLGLAGTAMLAGVVGNIADARGMSLGPISGRTLTAAATTAGAYALFRATEKRMPFVGDTMKYATAGAAVFTVGSLAWDALGAFNVTPPALVAYGMQVATGAGPMMSAAQDTEAPDVDTYQQ